MTNKFKDDASNPFEQVEDEPVMSLEEADKVLFGEIPEDLRIIATPLDIDNLTADRTQPRRAIPLSIRQDWDGNADDVQMLLSQWKLAAEKELNATVNAGKIIRNEAIDDVPEPDPKTQPMADKYMSLVQLATGIKREGLLNPIQIDRMGQGGLIVAGERRWLAHHLLRQYDSEKWGQIPCVDVAPNVWKQAQENGNRSPLNAIEMARQLALLYMDMYRGDDGVSFDPYEALVSPGGSDRAFYAQVADGNLYRTKRGFMEKILEATGLKSRHQVTRYRELLSLEDETWMQADDENWTEGRCRRVLHPEYFEDDDEDDMSTIVDISGENEGDMLSIDNISRKNERAPLEIRVGQVRAAFEDREIPYIVILSEEDEFQHECRVVYAGSYERSAWIHRDVIRDKWCYLLDHEPDAVPMDDGGDVADHPQADLRNWRETVKGVEVPIGNKIPDYPTDADAPDLTGDESPNRPSVYSQTTDQPDFDGLDEDEWETPEPIYQNMRQGDNGERVPYIVQYTLLKRLLNNLDVMARNLNLKGAIQTLQEINLLSPGTVDEMVANGGTEAVEQQFAYIEEGISSIVNGFLDQWETYKHDVLSAAYRVDEE